MKRYDPKTIEPKWQKKWEADKTYVVDFDSKKPKYVGFGMFNYPSGAGIHVGHVRNFTIPDVITRVKRQQGFESYQPVGWDSFGLPAENFAIKTGVSPQESTKTAIAKYHDQYRAMGWAVDWTKEINTTDPEYYKWTQWCFTKLFEHKLAYQQESAQWWCDQCKTVLADEQVINGKCWRHDGADDPLVMKKNLKQWFFKITEFADEMLEATDDLNWTQSVKASQKSWIGRSVGAEIDFKVDGSKDVIKVFTTRPDTLFGATFMVLAPEHPLVDKIVTSEQKKAVEDYKQATLLKSEVQRQQDADKEKTGVFTGAYAINPANDEKIPVWIADYVLMGYGTGAIMAVPAHDERDYAFAQKFDLKIQEVVQQRFVLGGKNAPRKDAETVERPIADIIIKNKSDEYLLIVEEDNIHFAGGGIEADDKNAAEAAKRETAEETGYVDIEAIAPLFNCVSEGYRIPKKRNAICSCQFFEITLASDKQVKNESDEGAHQLRWAKKDDVEQLITWEHHAEMWRRHQNNEACYGGEGIIVNSGSYDGLSSSEAREKIVADLAKKGLAQEKVNYKMRDWLISRQRYWGAPIPIIHCAKCGPVAVPEKDLPVVLPEIKEYRPTGGNASVLAGVESWINTKCPECGGSGKRETDTMDGYVCSSWYFLRYLDPSNNKQAWSPEQASTWMPIDFYNGGDHATAHLLYARFFTHFFHKLGLVDSSEPFKKMVFNGKIKAGDGSAFSKSKGNGIDPLEVIEQGYGADAIRLYEMFAAPVEFDVLWDEQGIPGSYRFLSRVWHITQEYLGTDNSKQSTVDSQAEQELLKTAHKTIKKVTEDVEGDRFNTAIAAMMENVNTLYKLKESHGMQQSDVWRFAIESLLQLVAPFAPHIAEELWSDLGHSDSIHVDHWPKWNEQYLVSDMMTIVVQVNGKVRANLELPADSDEQTITEAAQADDKVRTHIGGKNIKKSIYVPQKLVNFVI